MNEVKITFNSFHSSILYLIEKISKHNPVYGYRLNEATAIFGGLRGAYHGAELVFFFNNLDKMKIKITDENKKAVQVIQKQWSEFIRKGSISGIKTYNEEEKIIKYENGEYQMIEFTNKELIEKLRSSGIFEKERENYMEQR